MPRWIVKLVLCLLPLALTPLWVYRIAKGYLNFGGGEKDIILVIPWLVWAVLYAVLFVIVWVKGLLARHGFASAAGSATGLCVVLWLALLLWPAGWLGVS